MLGNEERDSPLLHTFLVLVHHVISHYLHVAPVAAQKEFTHEVRFRVECDAMMHVGVFGEEILQYVVIFLPLHVERQVYLRDSDIGEVVAHVMSESSLAVFLLFARHVTV